MISEANKELTQSVTRDEAEQVSETTLESFEFQPEPPRPTTNSSSLEELLRYHDRTFVEYVYAVVMQRRPTDSEVAETLAALREGEKGKVEIVEELVAAEKAAGRTVVVHGLPAPFLRSFSRLPVVGYVFRVLRGITRLPLLMQDKQRFESYSLAQQQRLTDYLNEEIVPALQRLSEGADNRSELRATVADAVDSVLMLSDSVIELAGKQNELAAEVVRRDNEVRQVVTQLTAVEVTQRELQSSFEKLAGVVDQLQAQTLALQEQREQSDKSLHEDLVRLTEAFQVLQKQFADLSQQSAEQVVAQREFLVQEQQSIVEAQKVALKEIGVELTETQDAIQERLNSLSETVNRLQKDLES